MKNLLLVITIFPVGIDQISKFWVEKNGWPTNLNTGVSWGLVSNWNSWLLIIVISISLFGMGFYLRKLTDQEKIWWVFIIGGGISNLIDRVMWGGVKDWIKIFAWFPWFNLADVFVSLGVMGLMVKYVKSRKEKTQT